MNETRQQAWQDTKRVRELASMLKSEITNLMAGWDAEGYQAVYRSLESAYNGTDEVVAKVVKAMTTARIRQAKRQAKIEK